MKIGILTTLWKRHDLETAVLSYWKDRILGDDPSYLDGFEFDLLAVGSEGEESASVAARAGWEYLEAPNEPLSDKWNAGARHLRGRGLDGIVVMGSDDIMTAAYFFALRDMVSQGAECVQIEDLYFYDVDSGSCVYSPRCHPGAGFYIGSSVLDRLDWQPWPSGVDRRLDGQMMGRIHGPGSPCSLRFIRDTARQGIILVDIKTNVNMWAYNEMSVNNGREESVDADALFDLFFPGFTERLQTVINR